MSRGKIRVTQDRGCGISLVVSNLREMREQISDRAGLIGARIDALIAERRLSRGQLADDVGLSRSAIDKLVHGEGAVGFAKLALMAEALGTTPNYILGFSEESGGASAHRPASAGNALDGNRVRDAIAQSYELLMNLPPDQALLLAQDVIKAAAAAQALPSPLEEAQLLRILVEHEVRKREK